MKKKFNILAILIIAFISIAITDKTLQNDTFYIIKVGESILKNGVDMLDHFSIHNIMYPYEHWLYNIFIYLIYSINGLESIYISTIFLCFILGLCLYFFNSKLTNNQIVSLIVTALVLSFSKTFITPRAQLISYILFVLEIYFIEKLLKKNKKRYLFYLVIDSWVLANVHSATWPMFIVFFMPYLATNLICWYRSKEINFNKKKIKIYKESGKLLFGIDHADSINDRINFSKYTNIRVLIITLFLCVLVAFLTPNHFQPFTHYIRLVMGGTIKWIGEHQPTVVFNNIGYLVVLLTLILYLIFVKVKIHIKDLLMLFGLCYLSISSYRHISLFFIIGSFSICNLFSDYFLMYAKKTYQLLLKVITKPFVYFTIIVISLFLCGFSYIFNIKDQEYIDKNMYPILAVEYINENIDKKSMRLYNDYNYGSYLLFKGIKVFIDSRASLYTKNFNKLDRDIADDYHNVSKTGNYKKVFEIYDITHALVNKGSILDKSLRLDDDYEIIYKDKNFVLFEKKVS